MQQVPDGMCERFLPRSEAADDQRSGRDAGDQGVGVWGAGGAAQGVPRSGTASNTPHVTELNGRSQQQLYTCCGGTEQRRFTSVYAPQHLELTE